MARITPDQIEYLIQNNNTGIEYEYALLYLLINDSTQKSRFESLVIQAHQKRTKILSIIQKTHIINLKDILATHNFKNYDVFIATQNDELGPSDIILKNELDNVLGLSVKYENNCSLNISSRYFLSDKSINKGYELLEDACTNYINEMKVNYGDVNKWFRTNKRSIHTDKFISSIVQMVLSDWELKSPDEKDQLLKKLMHAGSSIDFWIIKFSKKSSGFFLEVDTNPVTTINHALVTLTQETSSYVGFKINQDLFGKMQVKFNNGILEKPKGKVFDYEENGLKMKKGDPFGSWNFSIIINWNDIDE